jgi:hypothetical protein
MNNQDWNRIDSILERRQRKALHDRLEKEIERNIALECQNPHDKLLFFAADLVRHNAGQSVVEGYTGGI